MKSKNYTAAEKHFIQIEDGLRANIKKANATNSELISLLKAANVKLEALEEENSTLKLEREEMLKLLNMSEADFKKFLEKLSIENKLLGLLTVFPKRY